MQPRPCAEARMPCEPSARVGTTAMPMPGPDRLFWQLDFGGGCY